MRAGGFVAVAGTIGWCDGVTAVATGDAAVVDGVVKGSVGVGAADGFVVSLQAASALTSVTAMAAARIARTGLA